MFTSVLLLPRIDLSHSVNAVWVSIGLLIDLVLLPDFHISEPPSKYLLAKCPLFVQLLCWTRYLLKLHWHSFEPRFSVLNPDSHLENCQFERSSFYSFLLIHCIPAWHISILFFERLAHEFFYVSVYQSLLRRFHRVGWLHSKIRCQWLPAMTVPYLQEDR